MKEFWISTYCVIMTSSLCLLGYKHYRLQEAHYELVDIVADVIDLDYQESIDVIFDDIEDRYDD